LKLLKTKEAQPVAICMTLRPASFNTATTPSVWEVGPKQLQASLIDKVESYLASFNYNVMMLKVEATSRIIVQVCSRMTFNAHSAHFPNKPKELVSFVVYPSRSPVVWSTLTAPQSQGPFVVLDHKSSCLVTAGL